LTPDEIDERSRSAIKRWLANKQDQAAFAELYALHRAAVLKVVAARFERDVDDEDVNEMAQECWVEVNRTLENYAPRPGSRFRAWLLTMVRRRCIDARRHENTQAETRTGRLEPGVEVAAKDTKPEVHPLDMDGLKAELAQAVAALPDVDREILRLRNDEKLDFSVIADRLELTLGKVQGRYYAAAAKLDEIFNKYAL